MTGGLPVGWQMLADERLLVWLEANPDHPDADDVLEELDLRDHQRAANRGAMNGFAPEGEPS